MDNKPANLTNAEYDRLEAMKNPPGTRIIVVPHGHGLKGLSSEQIDLVGSGKSIVFEKDPPPAAGEGE